MFTLLNFADAEAFRSATVHSTSDLVLAFIVGNVEMKLARS